MSVRNLQRNPTRPGGYVGGANSAPIYVDSDDSKIKFIPGGFGSTTEVTLIDSNGKVGTYGTVTTYTGATDAIDISLGDIFFLSRAGAADAATLAAPAVADNGRTITIGSGTAFAHTITITAGIGGAGAAADVLTFAANTAASVTLKAIAGAWYVIGSNGVTIA